MLAVQAGAAMKSLSQIRLELEQLHASVLDGQRALLQCWRPVVAGKGFSPDAANLASYVAFRRQDLRKLQDRLLELGLSSLGRCEAHVLPTLESVGMALDAMLGMPPDEKRVRKMARASQEGGRRLLKHSDILLGKAPANRDMRIMVTLPSLAADDKRLVTDLARRGMDLARINCAHDDADAWKAMISHVRGASASGGRPCRVLMDLAGPKLRTGDIGAKSPSLRLKPKRDDGGEARTPAYFLLDASGELGGPGLGQVAGMARYPRIAVAREWLRRVRPGDAVELTDARGRKRRILVLDRLSDYHLLACVTETVLVTPGLALRHRANRRGTGGAETVVGPMEPQAGAIRVAMGDRILLTREDTDLVAACAPGGGGVCVGQVPCAQPEVLDFLKAGERVFIDDGRITAEVESVDEAGAWLRITRAAPEGDKIHSAKGLNFPDSDLALPSLTDKDLRDLDFVAGEADLVGYSFLRDATDMDRLGDELTARGAGHMGRIAKIENRQAVAHLPEIIVHGAASAPFGLMIARGDLAVELGWARLAEIQEEILWLAESARVPVIWATQVFEQMIRVNQPTRAEMTDAAMSQRAECVMLNKGPFVLDAIALLDDIAGRMQGHQLKKSARLRALHW
ncbi:MAG: pyruvate kinase [Thiobacillus sp.]|nr:pyruvate kinase [Thiobacillus sp.]